MQCKTKFVLNANFEGLSIAITCDSPEEVIQEIIRLHLRPGDWKVSRTTDITANINEMFLRGEA